MSNHELSASIAASLANTPEPGLPLENSLNPKNLTVEANFPARFLSRSQLISRLQKSY